MPSHPWARWSDERLLGLRLRDLDVRIRGTWLEEPLAQLNAELAARKLKLRPHAWLSTEWFCADGIPGIALPFFLAHPRLIRLERAQMGEAEGASHRWCMKLLRHEAGHVVQNAFALHRRKRWRDHFGPSSRPYPTTYVPKPSSKRFVQHLYLWYAQSHPAEDFAETFAVWLTPGLDWRKRYRGWDAYEKLAYVDALMAELAGETPSVRNRYVVDEVSELEQTLAEYYAAKRAHYQTPQTHAFDADLSRLFVRDPKRPPAASLLRRSRREIRAMVARWTGEDVFAVDEVFTRLITRAAQLDLRVGDDPEAAKRDFAVLLTARAMQVLYTGRERHPL